MAPAVLMLAASAAAADTHASRDPEALAREGTAAIEQRRFGDALEAFTTAMSMRPDEASLCFGAGIAAFMLGQDEVAEARFECALRLDPDHLPAATWLGDLYYRSGRLSEAIATYESQQRSPDGRDLAKQLAAWRAEYEMESRFHTVRGEHFIVRFGASADEPLARDVIDRLEAAHSRIGSILGAYPPQPVTVLLYTREQFLDITKLAAWSVAAYDGRIRLPLAGRPQQPEELDRVLSHEFVHAIVAMLGGRTVPAWVNEGLATLLEPEGAQDAEATLAGTSVRDALSSLHGSFVGLNTKDAEVAYASAALAVQRLIDQRGVGAVVALLKDLARGVTFARAFDQRLAMRYEDFLAAVRTNY
jgi:hypothetical protein